MDGWVWVRCPDVGALLRDYARSLSAGVNLGPVVTASGEMADALELDRVDLSGVLKGELEVVYLGGQALAGLSKLARLGARRVLYREGKLIADLTGLHVEDLAREGLVPAPWRRAPCGDQRSTSTQRSNRFEARNPTPHMSEVM